MAVVVDRGVRSQRVGHHQVELVEWVQCAFPRLARLRDTEDETQAERCDAVDLGEAGGCRGQLVEGNANLAGLVVQAGEPRAVTED